MHRLAHLILQLGELGTDPVKFIEFVETVHSTSVGMLRTVVQIKVEGQEMQTSLLCTAVAVSLVFGVVGCTAEGPAIVQSKNNEFQDQPTFMAMPRKDLELAAVKARDSLPEFRQLIQTLGGSAHPPLVKFRVPDADDVWLWLVVRDAKETGFVAETFEAPPELPQLKAGTRRWLSDTEVADWMIVGKQGVVHGAYSLRLQRERLPQGQRAAFDLRIGAQSYAPLPR